MTSQTNPSGKAAYSAPKLSVYGEFANLTAAAVGSVPEGGNKSATKSLA